MLKYDEGGEGKGGVDYVSQRGGEQFHNSNVLKRTASRLIYITVCLQIYHVPLDRVDLISLNIV